jgi:hypothetical protein
MTGRHHRVVHRVHLGGVRAQERQAGALPGRRLPVRVERPQHLVGVEHQPDAAGQHGLGVRFLVQFGRQVQPQSAVEGERRRHVRDGQPDCVESRSHDGDGTDAERLPS